MKQLTTSSAREETVLYYSRDFNLYHAIALKYQAETELLTIVTAACRHLHAPIELVLE